MFYHLCAIALILLVLGMAAIRRCNLYSPIVISSLIWLVVFITGLIVKERFYPLQEKAFIAWLIFFMVTNLIFFLLYPSRSIHARIENEIRKIPIDYTLLLLLLLVWLSYRIWVVGSGGPEYFFLNLRLSSNNIEGFLPIGFVARFYPLVFALFLFEHVYERKDNRHLRLMLWTLMLLYAIANMGKLNILTPMVSYIIIQGIKGKISILRISAYSGVVLAAMLAIHFIRSGGANETTIGDIFAIYIYSPLVALGYMNIDTTLPIASYVLRFFYALGNILDIAPHPVDVITPYVWIPEPTNVYTVMQPFYYDFGLLGVLLEAFFYGLFFSCLYWLSVKKGGLWLIIFSGFSIVLVGQFIVDLFIMLLSGNLQFLICASAIFLISKRICYVC